MLPYHTFGDGDQLLLAFHGFGQDASVFSSLKGDFKVFAFDLPFHGTAPLSYQNEASFIESFRDFFATLQNQRVTLMAYSIGGKAALALLRHFPQHIQRIILIAPDGIVIHPLYRIATRTYLGQLLFKTLMKGTWWLNPSLFLAKKLKLVPQSMIKMTRVQLGTKALRMRVYWTWVAHRDFESDVSKTAQMIQEHKMVVNFVLGKKDTIINYPQLQPLCDALGDYSYSLQWLDVGHFQLLPRYLSRVRLI